MSKTITKKKIVTKLRDLLGIYGRSSYAQCGEDILLKNLLNYIDIDKPYYVDIGAHHPKYLSNTYLFYKNGSRGICVEPDPVLFKTIERRRSRDLCLNVGIGTTDSEADFYVMSVPTLNTFSKQEAENYHNNSVFKIKQVIKLPLISVNKLLENFSEQTPDLISLDVEGLDFEILKSLDFDRHRPKLFCIETLSYDDKQDEVKAQEIIAYMEQNKYVVVADTWLNTIFADQKTWQDRIVGKH
jgi:FkbM family methyltransferase